jgi:hypothetical protein
MSNAFEVVTQFFKDDDWHFQKADGKSLVRLQYRGKSGEWSCYAEVRLEDSQFLFYSICPTYIPDDHRLPVAEYLTRANFGLVSGNFELDFSDGQVRYKTALDFDETELNPVLVRNLVYANLQTMDTYLSGIMRVIFGGVTPLEAIKEIEESD